jgi:hypothetical protein
MRSPIRTLVSFALFVMAAAACGGGGGRVALTPGAMPEGGQFGGVWNSPQYGRMDMVQTGSTIVGEYTKNERSGRIEGTAQGDLMRFTWTERRELVAGVPRVNRGRGYFRIVKDAEGFKLLGEWGHDDDETGGGPWNAVRTRWRPRLSGEGGGGDSGGEDSGNPDSSANESSGGESSEGSDDLDGL